MIQTYTIWAGDTQLDVGELNIALTFQLESLFDITKKKSSFSQTIKLPGTATNNKFFRHVFEVNLTERNFNRAINATPAEIRVSDGVLLSGNLRLLTINVNDLEVEYEVIISGIVENVLNDADSIPLNRIDLSKYNHQRTKETIKNSFTHLIYENGELVLKGIGDGYVYPYIIRELPSGNQGNEMYIYNSYPAIFVKTIIDYMMEYLGYSYTSSFFDSHYGRSLIIPYSGGRLQKPADEINELTTRVGVNGNAPEFNGGPVSGYVALTGVFGMGDGWQTNLNYDYGFNLNRDSGVVDDIDFQDPTNSWSEWGGWECPESGYYDISFNIKLVAKFFHQSGEDFHLNSAGQIQYWYELHKLDANGNLISVLYAPSEASAIIPETYGEDEYVHYAVGNPGHFAHQQSNIWLEEGERLAISFHYNYPTAGWNWFIPGGGFDPNDSVKCRLMAKESLEQDASRLIVAPSSNDSLDEGWVEMSNMLPDVSMKDFFLAIIRTFNLIVLSDANKEKSLTIEPYDDFFLSKRKVENWEYKLETAEDIRIYPMSEVNFKKHTLTYRQDSDFYNTEYQNETKEIYGQYTIDIDNDFSTEEKKTEILFSPSPMADQFIGNKVAPYFVKQTDIGEFQEQNVKMRLLFYGGVIGNETLYIKKSPNEAPELAVTSAGYPYCGMWDSPVAPSFDLGFGPTKKIYFDSEVYPAQTLYEKFYKNKIKNIIHKDAKLLEGMLHLTPGDIKDFDFRDIIFLKGQYWRVLEIKDYNPVGADSLTKVVLYKLIDFDKDIVVQNRIPVSSDSCPIDLTLVRIGIHYMYISPSGQEVTEDCCDSVNGEYISGRCYIREIGGDGPDGGQGEPPGIGQQPPGTLRVRSQNVPVPQNRGPIALNNRLNSINSTSIIVRGRNNYVGLDVQNALIVGNNNVIPDGISNVSILGDGIVAKYSNASYNGNIITFANGRVKDTSVRINDCGEDVVFDLFGSTKIGIADGGEDVVRDINLYNPTRYITDGNPINDLENE